MEGAEGDGGGGLKREVLGGDARGEVGFVEDYDDGGWCGEGLDGAGPGGVDDVEDEVTIVEEFFGGGLGGAVCRFGGQGRIEAGCIDELDGEGADSAGGGNVVACGAGDIGGDGLGAAGECVEEGAFAAVGRAGEDDLAAIDEGLCDTGAAEGFGGLALDGFERLGLDVCEPFFCGGGEAGAGLGGDEFDAGEGGGGELLEAGFELDGIVAVWAKTFIQHPVDGDEFCVTVLEHTHDGGCDQRVAVAVYVERLLA